MGELFKDGTSRDVTEQDLLAYGRLQEAQRQQRVPDLQGDNARSRLFFVGFDGTGQDFNNALQRPTSVGRFAGQALALADDPGRAVGAHYVAGIGTQRNLLARYADAALPFTWDDKLEEAYQRSLRRRRSGSSPTPRRRFASSQPAIAAAACSRPASRG